MKVVIAIDSFKGSVSSLEGGKEIERGIKQVYPDARTVIFPLADGGEGTTGALLSALGGRTIDVEVTGPLQERRVLAQYGILQDGITAVIETAAACGLPLVSELERQPLITTTYGVGELIRDAIGQGCRHFIIGLGGSATNDAGIGMLQALGFSFKDEKGNEVGFGGQALAQISTIVSSEVLPEISQCTFEVACDVSNPFYGPQGAAYVYAPQKGADSATVAQLDEGMACFAGVVKRAMDIDLQLIAGSGAAGGLGGAFAVFLNGQLRSGIDLLLDKMDIEQELADANIVITGEGRLDGQTTMGKAPLGLARMALKHNVPAIALAGGVTKEASVLNDLGIVSYFPIVSGPQSLEDAMNPVNAKDNLRRTAEQLFRLIRVMR